MRQNLESNKPEVYELKCLYVEDTFFQILYSNFHTDSEYARKIKVFRKTSSLLGLRIAGFLYRSKLVRCVRIRVSFEARFFVCFFINVLFESHFQSIVNSKGLGCLSKLFPLLES